MREKTAAQQRPKLPTPPLELRLWDDPSQEHDRTLLGCGVYATPGEWIDARHDWERKHGLAIEEWFALVCDHAADRGGLDAMNQAFSEYLADPEDDYEDPRSVMA